MRLLNTTTIEVERFTGNVPAYAILSHRWEDDEVTLEDMKAGGNSRGMKGYRKLRLSCAMAARQGLQYIWIDTCCIDKSSSAELSEAINSMFRYYKEAEVCYTYLSDVTAVKILGREAESQKSAFDQSAWFTRGWTLQELIAPDNMLFYNKDWDIIGTKADLRNILGQITKIPESVLLGGDLADESVSRKMSWVSSRQTTVPEDIAYCLLGMFGVNIPLLYGEGGENAFLRLQEAILKSSHDDSIFLWRATEEEAIRESFWGLLAKSPIYFTHSPDIPAPCTLAMTTNTPATLTGRGLDVEFLMAPVVIDKSDSFFSALVFLDGGKRAYGVLLQKLSYSGTHFARVGADVVLEIGSKLEIDIFHFPRRVRNIWALLAEASEIISTPSILKAPQALRFYVRQSPSIRPVASNEAVGFSFATSQSLPPELSIDDWSSSWERWESDFFIKSGSVYLLDFTMRNFSLDLSTLSGQGWDSELFGALQLSGLVTGNATQLILLVGLQHMSLNSLNTPLTCHRPWSVLYDISHVKGNPDQLLGDISSGKLKFGERHLIRRWACHGYAVSFDLQLRYGQPYYLIKVRKESDSDVLYTARTNTECGTSRV